MAELLRIYWPSIIAVVVLALSFVPDAWTAQARQALAGVRLPDFNGPSSPEEAAKAWIAWRQAEQVAIANDEAALAERKRRFAEADALVVKGAQ